ncbi:hypothetical protein lbkm_0995 [Lachnospiraceae bacterium KM106-2]|nr:hypothetical protein lbkm_0995 [Lachnospiraceae bacterium KM106-2]
MNQNHHNKRHPWKLLLLELVIIIILFLPIAYGINGSIGMTSRLLDNTTPDDYVRGWFVIPAIFGDLIMGIGFLIIVGMGIVYFAVIALVIGFHSVVASANKENKLSLFLVSIAPQGIFSIFIMGKISLFAIRSGGWCVLFYMVPVIILFIDTMIHVWDYKRDHK